VRLTLINKGNAFIVLIEVTRRCGNDVSKGDTVPFTSKERAVANSREARFNIKYGLQVVSMAI
jgi:hypothetical protein